MVCLIDIRFYVWGGVSFGVVSMRLLCCFSWFSVTSLVGLKLVCCYTPCEMCFAYVCLLRLD